MTQTEQTKAIAELDGWDLSEQKENPHAYKDPFGNLRPKSTVPSYLTSRDAIIPVIEKQPEEIQLKIARFIANNFTHSSKQDYLSGWILLAIKLTAEQLSEALLRAVGKWKD